MANLKSELCYLEFLAYQGFRSMPTLFAYHSQHSGFNGQPFTPSLFADGNGNPNLGHIRDCHLEQLIKNGKGLTVPVGSRNRVVSV